VARQAAAREGYEDEVALKKLAAEIAERERRCSTCGVVKPLKDGFYWDRWGMKYRSDCKLCVCTKRRVPGVVREASLRQRRVV